MLIPHPDHYPPATGGTLRLSWPVHDDENADQTHGGTDHVEPIRPIAVENPAPQKRQHNEKSPVGCIDATEVSGLQRRTTP